jgi:hypothetical protein
VEFFALRQNDNNKKYSMKRSDATPKERHVFRPPANQRNRLQQRELQLQGVADLRNTGPIVIWRCDCRDGQFLTEPKPIDLGLGFQVYWVYIQLDFSASALVGTLNG